MFGRKREEERQEEANVACCPPEPKFLVCVQCGHLFAPGTGKVIRTVAWDRARERNYCKTCAPPYDRVRVAIDGTVRYYVPVPAMYKEVTVTGRPVRRKKRA